MFTIERSEFLERASYAAALCSQVLGVEGDYGAERWRIEPVLLQALREAGMLDRGLRTLEPHLCRIRVEEGSPGSGARLTFYAPRLGRAEITACNEEGHDLSQGVTVSDGDGPSILVSRPIREGA